MYVGEWTWGCEASFFKRHCHLRFLASQLAEDSVCMSFGIPFLLAMWFHVSIPYKSRLTKWLPENDREFELSIHHWTVWFKPWGPRDSWTASDPWWKKGVNLDLLDLFLGPIKYTSSTYKEMDISVPLDGREYRGFAKWEHCVWKRPRWFAKERKSIWIEMNPSHGLPHAGKGENGWDCGDDALCGWGVDAKEGIEGAIASGVGKVLNYRDKYGHASTAA
jgi:hypothetical protein